MIPAQEDGIGRICWLASAIAGGWLWETPRQREESAFGLASSYLEFAKRRAEMPQHDMAAADAMPELFDIIAQSLSIKANRRLCKRLGIPYNPAYHTNNPF